MSPAVECLVYASMVARMVVASDMGPRTRCELHGHRQQTADERRGTRGRPLVGDKGDVWQPLHELLHHHAQLEPRQARTKAEVRAAAEGQVLVRRAGDVE